MICSSDTTCPQASQYRGGGRVSLLVDYICICKCWESLDKERVCDAAKSLTQLAIFVNIVKAAYTISPDRTYGNERTSNKVIIYVNR